MKINNLIKSLYLIVLLSMFTNLNAANDYTYYADEISNRFDKAYNLYKNNEKEEAKEVVSSAYFELFENLEGPIRINISSKKAYLMESQFTNLRKLIKKNVSATELKNKMQNLADEIYEVLPIINNGYQIIAEVGDEVDTSTEKKIENIEAVWLQALNYIKHDFSKALEVYEKDNSKKTRTFILDAQFEGYRNTSLEIAIRENKSISIDRQLQKGFTDLIKYIHTKPSKDALEIKMNEYIVMLKKEIIALPLIPRAKVVEIIVEKKVDYSIVLDNLYKEFDKAFVLYEKSENKEAIMLIQDAYFDIFEASGMESALGAKDASLKSKLESQFSKIISLIKNQSSQSDIQSEYLLMKNNFSKALEYFEKEEGFLLMFIYSLSIILREGFEALLIITAIIAYLIKSGNENKLSIVYTSFSTAIVFSFLTAFIMNFIFGASASENREVLEGSVMLIAAVLMFYVSYWLLSNAHSQKWNNYIKSQVQSSLDNKTSKALWFTVFLAVYREGAETVLFYQALIFDASSTNSYLALSLGFLLGSLILFVLYYIMKYSAIKLPIKIFFTFTGVLIFIMSFTFIGAGIMELIAGKVLEPSLMTWAPTIGFLGIYPYLEIIIPQVILLCFAVFAIFMLKKDKKNHPEGVKNS